MHIFRPFSIQSLIPIVVLNFHPQPILQFLIDTLLRRPLSTESERPCATLIIECIETSTCESIPHLFCRFCLNGVMCRIFVTKEYLSFHLKISRNALTMQVFLINCHRPVIKLRTCLSKCIIETDEELLRLIVIHIQLPLQRFLSKCFITSFSSSEYRQYSLILAMSFSSMTMRESSNTCFMSIS